MKTNKDSMFAQGDKPDSYESTLKRLVHCCLFKIEPQPVPSVTQPAKMVLQNDHAHWQELY